MLYHAQLYFWANENSHLKHLWPRRKVEPETLQPVGLCFVQHQSHNGTVRLTVGQSSLRAVLACAHLLHRLGLREGTRDCHRARDVRGTNPSLPSPPRRRSGDRCCPVRRARDCIQRGTERYDADKALPSRHGRAGAAARLNRSAALAPPRGPTRAARGGARSEDLTPSRSSHRSLGFVAGL